VNENTREKKGKEEGRKMQFRSLKVVVQERNAGKTTIKK